MCNKNPFKKSGSSKPKEAPTPAVSVAAPTNVSNAQADLGGTETNNMAKGKRRLTISRSGIGTGVNI